MTHYVYIPGLGDMFDPLRCVALWRWRRRGVQVALVPMRWGSRTETYEQKYTRIAKSIDEVSSGRVVLIGESAGGAMALLAFSRNPAKISGVITICGYNHGASDIVPYRRWRNPALHPLLVEVDSIVASLPLRQRQQITTLYSTRDRTVTPEHSMIDGAKEIVVHTPGHLMTIARILGGNGRIFVRSSIGED